MTIIVAAILFVILWVIFCHVDAILYEKTLSKSFAILDEVRAHGIWRFALGSGFYFAWKFRNR